MQEIFIKLIYHVSSETNTCDIKINISLDLFFASILEILEMFTALTS